MYGMLVKQERRARRARSAVRSELPLGSASDLAWLGVQAVIYLAFIAAACLLALLVVR